MTVNPMEMPEEYRAKWEAFVDGVNAVVRQVFETEDDANFVVAAQWGEMGHVASANTLPACMVTSDLEVCQVVQALDDVRDFVDGEHAAYHGSESPTSVQQERSLDDPNLPPEVRSLVEGLMAEYGVDASAVRIVEEVSTSDLAAMPTSTDDLSRAEG